MRNHDVRDLSHQTAGLASLSLLQALSIHTDNVPERRRSMGGMAVLFQRDGAPADTDTLDRLSDALAHRPADQTGQWISGPVGLSHRAFFSTPETDAKPQPLHDQERGLALTFDGRIDNRNELINALGLHAAASDARIVLRAYEKWQDKCPAHLLGDFAFAIWDECRQELFCARDFPGLKPFYFYCDADRFIGCTELQQILRLPGINAAINEGMVAEFLTGTITSARETLYRHVHRLAPGHSMRISATRKTINAYWDAHDIRPLLYRNDRDYADHVLATLHQAVQCRVRGGSPIGVYLSGGLDSSAVAAVACDQATDLEAFTLEFPDHPECDETAFSKEIARCLSVSLTTLRPSISHPVNVEIQALRYLDLPDYPGGTMKDVLHQAAASRGIRVVLTGIGGDECFARAGHLWAEWLHAGRYSQLFGDVRREFSVGPTKSVERILKQAIWPLMPVPIRNAKSRFFGESSVAGLADCGLRPEFSERVHLQRRLQRRPDPPRHWSPATRSLYQRFASGHASHAYECTERQAAPYGIEERHPFLDRRMIELALAMPEDQRTRGGVDRQVQRRALRGLIPERIRVKTEKADFSHVYPLTLEACFGTATDFRTYAVVKNGWIDPATAARMLEANLRAYRSGEYYYRDMWPLWMFYSLETWLAARRQLLNTQGNADPSPIDAAVHAGLA